MNNLLGEEIYRQRLNDKLTQDQFGAKFGVSGPAIFKFEKGFVRPSFDLWMRMAREFKLPERKAVLMWIKARLPDEYQDLIEITAEPIVITDGTKAGERTEGVNYAKIKDRKELRRKALADTYLPKALKAMLRDNEIWGVYKPSGDEINFLRDAFSRFPRATMANFREALRVLRSFQGKE